MNALRAALTDPLCGGMGLLAAGRSDWRIDPDEPLQRPMWGAMLRFLGRAVAPQLLAAGWSPRAWFAAKLRGGRDHGTVIHACKAVDNMMEQDAATRGSVEFLKSQLSR